MNSVRSTLGLLLGLVLAVFCFTGLYALRETDQAIITQFGRPIGGPVTTPGLHWKAPFVQTVNRLEKRVLEWDGPVTEMPTKDKTYIEVDTFARWRISDPTVFFVSTRDERSARSRIDDIIGSEVRTSVARHELIEIVRSDKEREPLKDDSLETLPSGIGGLGTLPPIQFGRLELEKEIKTLAAQKLRDLGIELMDVRFRRINYNAQVLDRIYQRMISERLQIAQRFRSEGEGEAARIMGTKQRDLASIESKAYRQVQQLQGEGDAEATRIYANAFNKDAQAADFYRFIKTMETYKTIWGGNSTVVFSTNSDLFRPLKTVQPGPIGEPAPAAAAPPADSGEPPPVPVLEAPAR